MPDGERIVVARVAEGIPFPSNNIVKDSVEGDVAVFNDRHTVIDGGVLLSALALKAIQVIAGTGLVGGGDLSASRTLAIDAGGVGTTELSDGSVIEAKIGTGAVTAGKIGSGAVTEAKLGTGAVTPDKIGAEAVTEAKLDDDSVSTAKVQDLAVTEAKLAAASVATTKLQNGSVTEQKIATGAVTSDKLATDAVATVKVQDRAVTTAKLDDEAVTTAKVEEGAITTELLADLTVTDAKVNDVAWGKITGKPTITTSPPTLSADATPSTGLVLTSSPQEIPSPQGLIPCLAIPESGQLFMRVSASGTLAATTYSGTVPILVSILVGGLSIGDFTMQASSAYCSDDSVAWHAQASLITLNGRAHNGIARSAFGAGGLGHKASGWPVASCPRVAGVIDFSGDEDKVVSVDASYDTNHSLPPSMPTLMLTLDTLVIEAIPVTP